MMKTYLILLLFICISSNCLSQINEVGFIAGCVNYVGDVGRTNYIYPKNTGYSFMYKYNLNPRIAIRANFSSFTISGDDADSENKIRQERGIKFENPNAKAVCGCGESFTI